VTFTLLLSAIRERANSRIRDGYYSERALARLLGVSQSQCHNVLKGARTLTPELADRLLTLLGLSVGFV
jgi:plasmid maintenance system antidote protein VapI